MESIYYLYIRASRTYRRPIDRYTNNILFNRCRPTYSKTYAKDSRVRSAYSHFIIKWNIERQILNLKWGGGGCDGRRERERERRIDDETMKTAVVLAHISRLFCIIDTTRGSCVLTLSQTFNRTSQVRMNIIFDFFSRHHPIDFPSNRKAPRTIFFPF